MSINVGIYSIGMYLPEPIRKNDWWPSSVVAGWKERTEYKILRSDKAPDTGAMSEGTRKSLAAIQEWVSDPFMGVKERRTLPDDMMVSDMETKAARDAIARAGIDPQEIGLVLGCPMGPDYIYAPTACVVHENLGLRPDCITSEVSAVCNAFAMQLMLAEQLICSGRVKYALLIQSSSMSRMAPMEDPTSAWFGDGATAVLVGPVAEGRGLLASKTRTYGKFNRGLVLGVPDRWWHAEGRCVPYSPDRRIGREMILSIADIAKELTTEALDAAKVSPGDVGFYASHQATPWLRPVTQEHIGLTNAKYADTFTWTASIMPANAPAQLAVGEREGYIRDGSIVTTFTGGGGVTCSALVLRWGR